MSYNTIITTDTDLCARAIKSGEIVAFGTETVYGLGADCFDEQAVKRIFEAKGRPVDNPLIVHVCSIEQAKTVANTWTEEMEQLAQRFWPGPFTMVVEKNPDIPDVVSAGLDTVGIRMPGNFGAVEFIKKCGVPIAAPSANTSRRPSPTTAMHVYHDMQGKIPYILDCGESRKGLESTVYDVAGKVVLRPGVITPKDLETVAGKVSIGGKETKKPQAPGMKYPHYCPGYRVILVVGEKSEEKIRELYLEYSGNGQKCAILDIEGKLKNMSAYVISFDGDMERCAAALYGTLLDLEASIDVLFVRGIEKKDLGLAIMNRLEKAAADNIIYC